MNRHHLLVYREPHWPAQIVAVPEHDTAILKREKQINEKKTPFDEILLIYDKNFQFGDLKWNL